MDDFTLYGTSPRAGVGGPKAKAAKGWVKQASRFFTSPVYSSLARGVHLLAGGADADANSMQADEAAAALSAAWQNQNRPRSPARYRASPSFTSQLPIFQTYTELVHSPWHAYLRAVYSGTFTFPLSMQSFTFFYADLLPADEAIPKRPALLDGPRSTDLWTEEWKHLRHGSHLKKLDSMYGPPEMAGVKGSSVIDLLWVYIYPWAGCHLGSWPHRLRAEVNASWPQATSLAAAPDRTPRASSSSSSSSPPSTMASPVAIDLTTDHQPERMLDPPFRYSSGFRKHSLVEVWHAEHPRQSGGYDTYGGVWMYLAVGSGVFHDLGRTAVYSDHQAAMEAFGLPPINTVDFSALFARGRTRGLDTMQFTHRCETLFKFEIVDLRPGPSKRRGPCPSYLGANRTYRGGWRGQQSCVCSSNLNNGCLNCRGMVKPWHSPMPFCPMGSARHD